MLNVETASMKFIHSHTSCHIIFETKFSQESIQESDSTHLFLDPLLSLFCDPCQRLQRINPTLHWMVSAEDYNQTSYFFFQNVNLLLHLQRYHSFIVFIPPQWSNLNLSAPTASALLLFMLLPPNPRILGVLLQLQLR